MIGDIEQAVLEIEEFARDVDRDDLTGAVADQLLSEGETVDQVRADGGRLAFADEIAVASEHAPRPGNVGYRPLVLCRQCSSSLPAPVQGLERGRINHRIPAQMFRRANNWN